MNKIAMVVAGLTLLAAQSAFAVQNESPRGDSAKNSMERARENPVGGSAAKPGSSAYTRTAKYKSERAAIDKKYAQQKQSVRQTTRSNTAKLKRNIKSGK